MWAKKCKKIWLLLDAKLFHYGQFLNIFKVRNLTLKNLGFGEVFFFEEMKFVFSELCIFQMKITVFCMKADMFS